MKTHKTLHSTCTDQLHELIIHFLFKSVIEFLSIAINTGAQGVNSVADESELQIFVQGETEDHSTCEERF